MNRRLASTVVVLLLAGCASSPPPPMYAWGSYESLIHANYSAPGSVPVEEQIRTLETERGSAGRRMPPGWHAHLGYLYVQAGQPELARGAFLSEKADYPEAAVLMDRLLQGLPDAGEQAREDS